MAFLRKSYGLDASTQRKIADAGPKTKKRTRGFRFENHRREVVRYPLWGKEPTGGLRDDAFFYYPRGKET